MNDRGAVDELTDSSRVELHNLRGRMPALKQSLSQFFARLTISPKNVMGLAFQEVGREMGGLASGELIQAVGFGCS